MASGAEARPRRLEASLEALGLGAVQRFVENSLIIFLALFRWLNLQSYVVNKVFFPLLQLLVFTLLGIYAGGRDTASYFVIGNSVVLASLGSLAVASSISEERAQATLTMILGSPASRLANLLQRGVVPVLDSLVTVAVALTFAALIFGIDFSQADLGALALSVLAAAASAAALGFLLGVITLAWLDLFFVWNIVFVLLLIVAGVNIPPDRLPEVLQPLHEIAPFGRSIEAARAAVAGSGLSRVGDLLLVELATAAAYFLAGYALLRRMETVALRRGSIEMT